MTAAKTYPVLGSGLGLRRDFIADVVEEPPSGVDFWEIAPENWIGIGGRYGRWLRALSERFPFVCHGLSLSIGSPDPLDFDFLRQLKGFLDQHQIRAYTEHLSYCSAQGHLYDLMPIPFTEAAVRHVAERVRIVQDVLDRPLALENVSYYAAPGQELSEIDFVTAVLETANCGLHLDVNNIYVNSINHGYDPGTYLARLPGERIVYAHMAGHSVEAEDLRVDTHGEDVIEPVWKLLAEAYARFGVFPTLLERDFQIPPLPALLGEVEQIRHLQQQAKLQEVGLAHD